MKWLNKIKKFFSKRSAKDQITREYDEYDEYFDSDDGYFEHKFRRTIQKSISEAGHMLRGAHGRSEIKQGYLDYINKYPEEYLYLENIDGGYLRPIANEYIEACAFYGFKKNRKIFKLDIGKHLPHIGSEGYNYYTSPNDFYFVPAVFAPFLRGSWPYEDEKLPIEGVDYSKEDYDFYVSSIQRLWDDLEDKSSYPIEVAKFIETCRLDGRILSLEEEGIWNT